MSRAAPHNRIQIKERRENVLVLLTKGTKGCEIAKELGVDASTVSRDIHYLIAQSQNYLNSEAKQPEHVFINLFVEKNRNSPNGDVDASQIQSQNHDNEQSQSQNNEQTTTIINCPPNSRCVIEQ